MSDVVPASRHPLLFPFRYSRKLLLIAIFAVRALAYLMFYYCEDLGTLFTFAIIFGLVDCKVESCPPTPS